MLHIATKNGSYHPVSLKYFTFQVIIQEFAFQRKFKNFCTITKNAIEQDSAIVHDEASNAVLAGMYALC